MQIPPCRNNRQLDFSLFFHQKPSQLEITQWPILNSNILTFYHNCCLFVRLGDHPLDSLDPWTTYGPVVTILIILLRLLSFLALPQVSEMRISCWSWQWYKIVFFSQLTFSPRSCSTWWACWPWTRSSRPPPSSRAPSSAPSSVSGLSPVESTQT